MKKHRLAVPATGRTREGPAAGGVTTTAFASTRAVARAHSIGGL